MVARGAEGLAMIAYDAWKLQTPPEAPLAGICECGCETGMTVHEGACCELCGASVRSGEGGCLRECTACGQSGCRACLVEVEGEWFCEPCMPAGEGA